MFFGNKVGPINYDQFDGYDNSESTQVDKRASHGFCECCTGDGTVPKINRRRKNARSRKSKETK